MTLVLENTSLVLWQEVVKTAEQRCSIILQDELEYYLISLLIRYTSKPELTKQVLANLFLEAMQLAKRERNYQLQRLGDECLLMAGLFPRSAIKKNVKPRYFVDLGRGAYHAISNTANDIFDLLAGQFVPLMDVLQSIPEHSVLLPLEAYDQWNEMGSKRAFHILQSYSKGVLSKKIYR